MKRMQTSGVIAVCLGMLACGDAGTTTPDEGNATSGQTAGNGNNGGNGADSSGLKDGDPVDLDGDGQKDDGVAIDEDGDGKVDGVDTDGDGKIDAPLPGGSSGSSAGSNGGANGTTTPDTDGAVDEPLACDGVGVCDDNFKDTCDGMPDNCPTTQSAGIDEPAWDCAGEPPANVYAYATFPEGTKVAGANLAAGACVAFFEGAKDLFYAKWFKFGPKTVTADCSDYDGCICPSAAGNNWDRRLYAFTWSGDDACERVALVDHANVPGGTNEQAVSNACRKYLYALHGDGNPNILIAPDGQKSFDLPFSYVAGSTAALKRRLADFPKVEVSCVEVKGPGVPAAQLMVSDVKTNGAFKKKL